MKKKLAIIGASYLQKPLVLKAKEMGLETHCFAWEDGAVCKELVDYFYPISVLEKEEILKVCKTLKIDGILSIASDIAVPTVSYVAEKLNLTSNSLKTAINSTNKIKMKQKFLENNVSTPQLFSLNNYNSNKKDINFPLIVKPADRSGSRGIYKVTNQKDLQNAVERAKKESFNNEILIEEFIEGVEVSVESISWMGEHYILAITDKVTTNEPFFVEIEHHQPSQLPLKIKEKIKSETIKALNALNINFGASHTEIRITNDEQLYVVEVGARMGGDFIGSNLVQLSTGYDFIKGVIEIALGNFQGINKKFRKYAGVYFLCKETEEVKQFINNKDKHKEIVQVEITDSKLYNVEKSADRSGYFIYQSNSKFLV